MMLTATKEDMFVFLFKVCKFVHHRTIKINHQPDVTIFSLFS